MGWRNFIFACHRVISDKSWENEQKCASRRLNEDTECLYIEKIVGIFLGYLVTFNEVVL